MAIDTGYDDATDDERTVSLGTAKIDVTKPVAADHHCVYTFRAMTKSLTSSAKQTQSVKKKKGASSSKRPRAVEVVQCPSDFPKFQDFRPCKKPPPPPRAAHQQEQHERQKRETRLLDFHETAREIHSLGATAFDGRQKRSHQQEEYKRLTGGRAPKQPRVPLPILLGIQQKAAQRQKQQLEEAREAGIVLPRDNNNNNNKKKKRSRGTNAARVHGPAPDVGFMRKGMLKVRSKPK